MSYQSGGGLLNLSNENLSLRRCFKTQNNILTSSKVVILPHNVNNDLYECHDLSKFVRNIKMDLK